MAEMAENLRRAAIERERMEAGTDGDSLHWHKVQQTRDMQKKLENMDDPDGMAQRMADRLQKIRDDLDAGKGFDQEGYDKVRNAYGKMTRDTIAGESSLPGNYSDWDNVKDMTKLTADDLARGNGWKSIAVRVGAAIVTGGYSEFGFEAARATTIMKDYVDRGGDSAAEAFVEATTQTLIDEGIGRGIGFGIKVAGSSVRYVGGKIATPISSAINAAKPQVNKLLKNASKALVNTVDDMAKAAKSALGYTDDAAKSIGNQVDDMAKATAKEADNMAKSAANQIDDAAKNVKNQSDDIIKSGEKSADDIAKNAEKQSKEAAEKAAKESEKSAGQGAKQAKESAKKAKEAAEKAERFIKKQQEEAAAEAERLIKENRGKVQESAELQKRHEAFIEGRKAGAEKVKKMEEAKKALDQNPSSQEAKKAYEAAAKEVQQDKHAVHVLNESGDAATKTRSDFNTTMKQKDLAAEANAKERIAKEFNTDPDKIHSVSASNKMNTSDVAESAGVAKKPKNGIITDGRDPIAANANEIKAPVDPGDKTGFDIDKTFRIEKKVVDPVTGKTKTIMQDIPAKDVERIYNEEFYKQWHDGKLPTKVDAKGNTIVDSDAVNKFGKDMDIAAVDQSSAEAYGMGGSDLKNALKKDNTVKNFKDVGSVSKTIEHKSYEWKNLADDTRSTGDSSLLPKAEGFSEESIRQATKQYQNQIVAQTKALNTNANANIYKIPDKHATAMEILKKIGNKPGDISVAEAEAVLNSYGTSIDKVIQQNSALMESMSKQRLQ